jgi:hypothetical protein
MQQLAGQASLAMTQRDREGDADAKRRLIALLEHRPAVSAGCPMAGASRPSSSVRLIALGT